MKKLKEVFSNNNYLLAKIVGGVVAGATAIIVIVAITTKNKEVAAEVRTTSHEEITTVEEKITSTEQIVEEKTSSEELSSNIEVTSEEEITTSIVVDSGETSTKESTTKQTTTVKPTTTAKQTTTVKPTTTTAPTTTTKPTTTKQPETTAEEETTKPPRGANGVILEELSVALLQNGEEIPYTIPKTWSQYVREQGTLILSPAYDAVPKECRQDVFGNEVLLYQKKGNVITGSTAEDIVAIYGKPYYAGKKPKNGAVRLYYKYLDPSLSEEEQVYITFLFSKDRTENRLWAITIYGKENYMSDYSEEIVY